MTLLPADISMPTSAEMRRIQFVEPALQAAVGAD